VNRRGERKGKDRKKALLGFIARRWTLLSTRAASRHRKSTRGARVLRKVKSGNRWSKKENRLQKERREKRKVVRGTHYKSTEGVVTAGVFREMEKRRGKKYPVLTEGNRPATTNSLGGSWPLKNQKEKKLGRVSPHLCDFKKCY